jgi:drug/metabolite transporter (DMT)-like permease
MGCHSSAILLRGAPLLFVLLWSSSFVAVKIGLLYLSPLLFVTIRLWLCALVLVALMAALRRSWRPLRRWRWLHCGVAGALVNGAGLLAPHAAMVVVPAAQIALVQALTPLLTALLGVVFLREALMLRQWVGLMLGMAGVGLVVGRAAFENTTRFNGLLLGFLGVIGLATGTLYFSRFCRAVPLLPGATAQFIGAALVSAAATWVFEAPRAIFTQQAVVAIAWNTVVTSLGGMALYFFILSRGTAARASANFYLVPGVSALFAWAALGERPTILAVAGLLVASAGCWLVSGWRPRRLTH